MVYFKSSLTEELINYKIKLFFCEKRSFILADCTLQVSNKKKLNQKVSTSHTKNDLRKESVNSNLIFIHDFYQANATEISRIIKRKN